MDGRWGRQARRHARCFAGLGCRALVDLFGRAARRHCCARAARLQDDGTQGSHPVWSLPCSRWSCRPLLRRKARDLVHERIRRLGVRGVGLAELIVVMAILGLLAAIGVPYLVSYWQATTLPAGTQELQTIAHGQRPLAIRNKAYVYEH